jgi:hypothetical protein
MWYRNTKACIPEQKRKIRFTRRKINKGKSDGGSLLEREGEMKLPGSPSLSPHGRLVRFIWGEPVTVKSIACINLHQ